MTVEPVAAFRPVAPDADWETVRVRLMTALGTLVPTAWSDHNPIDPGVTLAEVAAFGLADLHYRTAERRFPAWPLEAHAWADEADRHWAASLPVGTPPAAATPVTPLTDLARALAAPAPAGAGEPGLSTATVLEPLVRACLEPADATALLAAPPWDAVVPPELRPAAVAVLRARWLRRVAHELTDLVAAAVEAERSRGGPVADRDARAVAALSLTLPLWADELAAVVRRERRRLTAAAVVEHLDRIRGALTPAAVTAVRGVLAAADLTTEEVDLAMGASPTPLGVLPEGLERVDGTTRVWPPHPLQSLTCEPTTADDYARRARAHPFVARSWAVPGQLPGVAWDGRPVATAVPRKGAVTLVVERRPRPPDVPASAWPDDEAFAREVLAVAVGSEVVQPHPTWRDTLDPLDPRRVVCDEVGATWLKRCEVVLQGTLVTGTGIDRAAAVAEALARVAAHLATGRPESRTAQAGLRAGTPSVDGPWPRLDQPGPGWVPGDRIRFTEVVQAVVADPVVLGVENLAIKVGAGPFVPSIDGVVALDPDCVPVLAEVQCLRVRLSLTAECGDA